MNRFAEILDVIKIERAKKDNGVHLPIPIADCGNCVFTDFQPLVDLLRLHKWNKSEIGRLLGVSNVAVGQWIDGHRAINFASRQKVISVLKRENEVTNGVS